MGPYQMRARFNARVKARARASALRGKFRRENIRNCLPFPPARSTRAGTIMGRKLESEPSYSSFFEVSGLTGSRFQG
jgi:hypothetical protein